MGMFDTLYVERDGQTIGIQTKEFDCAMRHYDLGESIDTGSNRVVPAQVVVEDFRLGRTPEEWVQEWAVFVLIHHVFADYALCQTEDEALEMAAALARVYHDTGRQAEALARAARHLSDRKQKLQRTWWGIHNMLSAYRRQEEARAAGEVLHPLHLIHWDFSKMTLADALDKQLND